MKRSLIFVMGLAGLILIPAAALAQASISRTPSLSNRCQRVTATLEGRSASFGQAAATRAAVLARVNERLTGLIGRADAQKYNVAQLRADQTLLQRRTAAVSADFAGLKSALAQAEGQCGAAGSLTGARAKLAAARSDVDALRDWVNQTLQPDLLALKQAKRS